MELNLVKIPLNNWKNYTMNNCQIFWGGEDVDPSLYNHHRHYTTNSNILRDIKEEALFHYCIDNKIPMLGICRGAQFLNVMNGGTLIQDIYGHTKGHTVTALDINKDFYVTSTHHQMMVPTKDAIILAIDKREVLCLDSPTSNTYVPKEGIEAVYYPKTMCICVQFHPEWMDPKTEARQWLDSLTLKYFNQIVDLTT